METETRLYHRRNLTRLHRNQRRLELGRHHALRESAERSTLLCRSRILTEFTCKLREIRRREHFVQRIGARVQLLQLFRCCALLRHAEKNVAGGEHFAIVIARLIVDWRGDTEALRHNFEELACARIRNRRPECRIEFFRAIERITNRAGLGQQLVVHPQVSNDAHHILAQRDLRCTEQLGELLDGEFLRTGLRNGVRVCTERTAVAADELGHGANGNRGEGNSSHSENGDSGEAATVRQGRSVDTDESIPISGSDCAGNGRGLRAPQLRQVA